MKKIDFTQLWHSRCLMALMVMLLALLPGVGWATTLTLGNLVVETDGVENTDYSWNESEKIFKVLTPTPATFSTNGTFTGQIAVSEGVTGAVITLGNLTIDRGALWASGGSSALLIGKNATAKIILQDGATATMRGAWEQESMHVAEGAAATIEGSGSLTVNSAYIQGAGHGAAILLPKTATLTINSGKVTANSAECNAGEGAAIGGRQYAHETGCGTLIINGGEVTLTANKAAAFGGGSSCGYTDEPNGGDGGTLIVNGGTLNAQGRIGGGASFSNGNGGCGGSITINGGTVTSTMDLGSAENATSVGSINLVGGTLTTPSLTMVDGAITIKQSMTLADELTTLLPITIAENVVLTVPEGFNFDISSTKITLATGAKLNNLNVPTLNTDGYYEISTVTQMKWFAGLVNGTLTDGTEKNKKANGILMADLDLQNEPWTPMGQYDPWNGTGNTYEGKFDGNYHTISNLYVNSGYARGFFGECLGTIKNLGVINAEITPGEGTVGVIAAAVWHAHVVNCWSAGKITLATADDCTGVAGIANIEECSSAKNCHTSYSAIAGSVSTNQAGTDGCTANIPSDAYKTGEIAYLLNTNKQTDETCSWGQTIGTDAHPVALEEGSNEVYKHEMAQEATTITLKVDNLYNRTTTLCFPKDVNLPEKVMAFTVIGVDGSSNSSYYDNAIMSKLETNVLPANTPVLLMNTGTETATISLPAISGYYTNSETATDAISQEGNLLKGTYSERNLNETTQYYHSYSYFVRNRSITLSAYQCFLEIEGGKEYYRVETAEPIGDIEYAVLSEEEKTCYVSRIFYAGIGTSDCEVTIPSTTQIGGEDYKVVQLGLCTDDDIDKCHFINMNGNYNNVLYINLPKTIKTVGRQVLCNLSLGESSGQTIVRFSTDEAPEFKSSNTDLNRFWAKIEVPYAAEDVYKAAWGGDGIYTTSRKTELDIANGDIEVFMGGVYSQESTSAGDSSTGIPDISHGKIDGTLVIKGTSTTNKVWIRDCLGDEPLRIAINGLNIDLSESTEATSAITVDFANVSLIVQGENTLNTSSAVKGITVSDAESSLSINALSTGTLDVSSGISGDNVAVAAKVYEGSSECTTQNVTASTTLNTDKNQLAFSNYDFVTGPTNLVANGKCEKFILNDAVDVYAPSAFTAKEVTYRRGFEDNDFNSLYLPFSVNVDDFEDCEFYVINMFHQEDTDGDGVLDNITLEVGKVPAGSTLLPNHPYLFKYKGTTLGDAVDFTLTDIDVEPTESKTFECSSMSYKYEFTGSYQSKTAEELADYYVIGIDNATQKTALVHTTTEPLQAMRWAMKMTPRDSQYGQAAASKAPLCVSIVEGGDGTITGISSVKSADDNDDAYYDLNGVRKSKMTQGVNIVKTADGRVIKVVKQ